MKLYYSPGLCSLSPHIALREAGLEAQLVKVDVATHTYGGGRDYREVNPLGYVPVLELDDGERLVEGPAIVQHIADLVPASGLAPAAGTRERVRLQSWLGYVNSELHKGMAPLFDPAAPDAYKDVVRAKVSARLAHVAAHLADRPYLLGDRFTVADGYLYTVVAWHRYVGIDLAAWPALQAFQQRIAARPAVQAALKAEGLLR